MINEQAPRPYRFLIEVLLFLTYAVFGLSWIAITPLVGDIQKEFGVTLTQLALLTTMVSVAKVIAPLVTGALAVRIGLRNTILVGSAFISVAAIAPLATDFNVFLGARFLFGIGGAVVVTLLGPMVMQWFPKSELPIVNAFNNVAVNTGITVTLFSTVPLAAQFGWRNTMLGYGLISVALMIAWAILGRDGAPREIKTETSSSVGYADVWKMKETWIIAFSFAGPLALYLAFNTWLPKFYMEAYMMDKATASGYTGLFNLVGIPTAIVAGFATKALGLRRPFIIAAGFLMVLAGCMMTMSPNPLIIGTGAVLLGIAMFTYVAPLFTIPMELPGVTPQHIALMMGTVFSVSYFFSSFSPVVVGKIHDAGGSFVTGFTVWIAFSFILAIGGFLLPETGPRARKPH